MLVLRNLLLILSASKYLKMLKLLNFLRIIRLAKVLEQSKKLQEMKLNTRKKQQSNFLIRKSLIQLNKGLKPRPAIKAIDVLAGLRKAKRLSAVNSSYTNLKKHINIEESNKLVLSDNRGENGSKCNTENEQMINRSSAPLQENGNTNNNDCGYSHTAHNFKLQLKSSRHEFNNPIEYDLTKFLEKRKLTVDDLLRKSDNIQNGVNIDNNNNFNNANIVNKQDHIRIIPNIIIPPRKKTNMVTEHIDPIKIQVERNDRFHRRRFPITLQKVSIHENNNESSVERFSVDFDENKDSNRLRRNKADILASRALSLKRKQFGTTKITRNSLEGLLHADSNTKSFSNVGEMVRKRNPSEISEPFFLINENDTKLKTLSRLRRTTTLGPSAVEVVSRCIYKISTRKEEDEDFKGNDLEKILFQKITQKVVIMIMFLLISLPILDVDYITSFVYPPETLPTVTNFCVNGLDSIFTQALTNPVYLSSINLFIYHCTNTSDTPDYIPYFINLNFSRYDLYYNLTELYNNTEYAKDLPNMVFNYDNFNVTPYFNRSSRDYQQGDISFGDDSYISYSLDTYLKYRLMSLLNLAKNIFVSALLIICALVFSNDTTVHVIQPVNKIMARLGFYLNNFDMIEKADPEKMKLDEKSIVLINEKKNTLLKYKRKKDQNSKKMETYLIDKAMKKLISLISLSIGKPILLSAYSDKNRLNLNASQAAGYKFNAVMLKLKLSNVDSMIDRYNEKAMTIINQIYQIFHCTGLNFFGDVYSKQNIIFWKENKKTGDIDTRKYINKISNITISEKDFENIESNIIDGHPYIDYSLDYIMSAGLLCANHFLRSLKKNYKKIFNFLQKNEIGLLMYLDYGEFIGGYVGYQFKMDEVYLSPKINQAEKILQEISSRGNSIFIFEDYYELLEDNLKQYLYPSALIKLTAQSLCYTLFRQFMVESLNNKSHRPSLFNSPLDEDDIESFFKDDIKTIINNILKNRKDIEADFFSSDHDMTTFILDDEAFRLNTGGKVNFQLTQALTLLFKNICTNQVSECYEIVRFIDKMKKLKIYDSELKKQVLVIKQFLSESVIPINFTIEI
jgi:hypothetical protein